MEPIGSEYAVILYDPKLRRTLVERPERLSSASGSSAQINLRFKLAQALRTLASNVEPRQPALDIAGPRQPASPQ